MTVDFASRIAAITSVNKDLWVTLERNVRLVSHQGEVRSRGVIIYWRGHDPACNRSGLSLLALSDECMHKVIRYLDLNSKCNFYDTSKRSCQLISEHILNHKFSTTLNSDDGILQRLGKHIRRMKLDINAIIFDDEHDDEVIESWRRLNQLCPKITELTLTSIFYVLNDFRHIPILRWPNLRKLVFATPYPVNNRVLCSFVCPMLTNLDIRSYVGDYENTDAGREMSHIRSFTNLRILKFGSYSESVARFLSALTSNVCNQMKELSICNVRVGTWNMLPVHSKEQRVMTMKLINLVSRFRNLAVLHLIIPDLNYANLKFLFESCAKLTEVSICTHGYHFASEIKNIRNSCKEIKKLRLIFQHSNAIIHSRHVRNVSKMLPGVSIDVIYINGDQTFIAKPMKFDFLHSYGG